VRYWLEENGFVSKKINSEIERVSLTLERNYEIRENSKGANKNDILLIASAKHCHYTVVTLESKQPNLPSKKSNYKIPAICREEAVSCIDFITLLRQLKAQEQWVIKNEN
jgi:hypothetical protein